jgi:hypothetical protein
MIEHPEYMRSHAVAHHEALIQEAAEERRARAFDEANQERGSLVKNLNHWAAELKIWARPAHRAQTRA